VGLAREADRVSEGDFARLPMACCCFCRGQRADFIIRAVKKGSAPATAHSESVVARAGILGGGMEAVEPSVFSYAHVVTGGGGSRQDFHAGFKTRKHWVGMPQCLQQGTGLGWVGAAPMTRGLPLWKAMRSRRCLAAG